MLLIGLAWGWRRWSRRFAGAAACSDMYLIVSSHVLAGSILLSVGILGEYVGRIWEQVRCRPELSAQVRFALGFRRGRPSAAAHQGIRGEANRAGKRLNQRNIKPEGEGAPQPLGLGVPACFGVRPNRSPAGRKSARSPSSSSCSRSAAWSSAARP